MLQKKNRILGRAAFFFAIAILGGILALALPQAAQNPDTPEITTQERDLDYKLKAESNAVTVRVVVRDARGHAVANLRKEDFRLLDNGKPQVIQEAAIESPSSATTPADETARTETGGNTSPPRRALRYGGPVNVAHALSVAILRRYSLEF